ncbi:MAG: hypothetical protein LIO76_03720 [Clostridiales bacterium]|nr:hypothetical protein [Clostridiales bacterium]
METVFLVAHKENYFYPYEEACMQITGNTWYYFAAAKLCSVFDLALPGRFWRTDRIRENVKTIVITDAVFQPSLYKALKKEYYDTRIILYYMNPILSYNKGFMKYCREVYTFDRDDARTYGLMYKHTPYTEKIRKKDCETDIDAFFLGREKNRLPEIRSARKLLEDAGLRTRFLVYGTRDASLRMDTYMSYEDYLDQVMRSKCLVEINVPGQTGCSLRFMEALFFQKKLITNNAAIRQDDWYRKENVYILGEDNRDLQEFMRTPYHSEGLDLSDLVFSDWIRGFG